MWIYAVRNTEFLPAEHPPAIRNLVIDSRAAGIPLAGTWFAWAEGDEAQSFSYGEDPGDVLNKLCQKIEILLSTIAYKRQQIRAYYWRFPRPAVPAQMICCDCNGTGEYRGLNEVESCKNCSGTGKIQPTHGVSPLQAIGRDWASEAIAATSGPWFPPPPASQLWQP